MNPIPDDELLSAYLDGELSAADRARAEQLLAEQPEARQLLEDLRALHGGFEGLPVHRLDQDFPARVLRGAEREMLAAEPSAESLPADQAAPGVKPLAAASPHPEPERSVPPLQPSFGWARWRRPVVWAGLAMAAGLLLMVYDRNLRPPARQGQVAHAPSAASEMRAANGPEPAPAGNEPLFARDGASHKEIRDEPSGATDRLNLGASREADAAPADGSAQSGRRAMRRSKSDFESSAPKAADPTAAPSEELGKARGQKPSPGAGSMSAKQTESFRLRQSGMPRQEAQVGGLPLYDVELQQDGKLVSEPLDENTLIVWCDVDADVADQPEFQQMLASNKIAWEPDLAIGQAGQAAPSEKAPASALKSLNKSTGESVDKKSQVAGGGEASVKQKPAGRGERLRELTEKQLGDMRKETRDRAQIVAETLSEDNADYVLVEATEAQLKAVLTEIDRNPEMFLSVNVEPAAEVPAQQAYRSYNRGRAGPPQLKSRISNDARKSEPKQTSSAGAAPAAAAGKDAARPPGAAGRLQFGRAQRVVISQQSPEALEAFSGRGTQDVSAAESEKREAQKESLLREDKGKRSSPGGESKAAKVAAPAKSRGLATPAAVPAKPDVPAPAPSESDSGAQARRGYQQALFIFRRVSPPEEAAEPAGAVKKPQ